MAGFCETWGCTTSKGRVCVVEINVTKSDGMKVGGFSVSFPTPRLPHWPFQYTVHTLEAVRQSLEVGGIPLLTLYRPGAYSISGE